MTCIVGVIEDGVVYLGGDSAITAGDTKWCLNEPKVFLSEDRKMGIGYAGLLRIGNVLKYKFKIPKLRRDINKYIYKDFVDALRECFKANGISIDGDGDFQVLVAVKGKLFSIDEGFGVSEIRDKFAAIGSGTDYALGSLFSTMGQDPNGRVMAALEASAHFSTNVGAPFYVEKVRP